MELLNVLFVADKSNFRDPKPLRIRQRTGDRLVFGEAVGPQMDFRLRDLIGRILEKFVELCPVRNRRAVPNRRSVEVDLQIDDHGWRCLRRRIGFACGRSSFTACVWMGIVTINMTRSTSMTSISGVVFISTITSSVPLGRTNAH